MKTQSLSAFVDFGWVAALYPIQGAMVIGVGQEKTPWMNLFAETGCENIVLFDADLAALERIQSIAEKPGWRFEHQVVARHSGDVPFYTVANRSESCLIHPDSLRDLWPNVHLRDETVAPGRSLAELLQQSPAIANWLVVDCLPGVELIADVEIEKVDVVVLRMVMHEQPAVALAACSKTATDDFMEKKGFICLNHSSERHPKLGYGLYVRDYATAINQFRNQAETLKKQNDDLRDANAALKRDFDTVVPNFKRLENSIAQNKEASNLLMRTAQQVADNEQALLQSEAKGMEAAPLPTAQSGGTAAFERHGYSYLETQLLLIVMGLSDELSKVNHTMNQGRHQQTEQILQQLESFMGIQYYLKEGKFLPDMHEWPISPDIALWMMELVATRDYDLILEFGSGTSTLLMAQTLLKATDQGQLKKAAIQVAFEHSAKYHANTLRLLSQAGVERRVDLMLTPLEPYTAPKDDRSRYSYYSCGEKMASLARQFRSNRQPTKIFMLVDGPPGSTNKHARYPALQHVLNAFPNAQIDLVLDDYQRQEEKDIAQMWMDDLREQGRDFYKTDRKMEKQDRPPPAGHHCFFGTRQRWADHCSRTVRAI